MEDEQLKAGDLVAFRPGHAIYPIRVMLHVGTIRQVVHEPGQSAVAVIDWIHSTGGFKVSRAPMFKLVKVDYVELPGPPTEVEFLRAMVFVLYEHAARTPGGYYALHAAATDATILARQYEKRVRNFYEIVLY
jgi:hypothetical protein